MSQFFESFRRGAKQVEKNKIKNGNKAIFFMLSIDEYGAFLEVVDDKNKPIIVSHTEYSGIKRSILKAIEQITDQQDFIINWTNPTAKIYFRDHEYLLDQLKHTDNFVNAERNRIVFAKNKGYIKLIINDKNENEYQAFIEIPYDDAKIDDFFLLTESYVFFNGTITEIEPIGLHFNQIIDFETVFPKAEIYKYLSLFFSYFENITLVFGDYEIEEFEEKALAEPCLFFEKVDSDNSLHLRIGQSLPALGANFLDEFEIYKIAEINELEHKINIKYIDQRPISYYVEMIEKMISKYYEKSKGKLGVILENETFIIADTMAGKFIYNDLATLLNTFKIFGAEKLKSYKISTTQPKLDIRMGSGIDFLEGEVNLDFGSEKISLFDAINQLRKNKYIQLSDGSHALINEAYIDRLERLFKKKKDKVELSFFDLPLVEDLLNEPLTEHIFTKSLSFFKGLGNLADSIYKVNKTVNAKLRPYQTLGVQWLEYLQKNNYNGCLADEMGLGKTLQTIALLANFYPKEKKPTLIVMPKSLLYNWQNEVSKFAPNISTYMYYETQRDIAEATKHQLIFTTYAMLRNEIEVFMEQKYFYVILDESQNIKNLQSQTTKAALLLKSNHRMALSGTPIENNLGELYSLFRFLNPTMFGSVEHFNHQYLSAIQRNNSADATNDLRKKIYPFILRRLKKDVLKELPDKTEQIYYVDMTEPQKKLYEQRRTFYKKAIEAEISEKGVSQSQFFMFQAINELRQIATIPEAKSDGSIESPKLEFLIDQISELALNGHKSLVFVNFLQAIDLIGDALEKQGIEYVAMSGSTRDRQKLVDRFQNEPRCKVFVMTLKTGGTGLNLTAASNVFIFDPWWNYAAESQAIDRAHRIGQTQKVFSYKIIAKDSIEEKILLLQQKKAELFKNIISADSSSIKSFSEDDIRFILS